jgi:hypothetical protein
MNRAAANSISVFKSKPGERPKIDPNFEEVTEDAEESMKERCSGRIG